MCASGMSTVDEELSAILQSHQSAGDASLAGVVPSHTSSALSAGGGGGVFSDGHHLYSAGCILGSGIKLYSDSSGKKQGMPIRTINMPPLDQGGQNFAPCSPMLPKNGIRRQGWPAVSAHKGWLSGKNGVMDVDENLADYASLLDPVSDSLRAPAVLTRYHSAPSSFLASLAELQEDASRQSNPQPDTLLSSYFTDDLPTLNTCNDNSVEHMDTEPDSYKYLMKQRKFDGLGGSCPPYDHQMASRNGSCAGKLSSHSPVFKQTLDVLHEGSSQIQMPATMGLAQATQAGQQTNDVSLPMSTFASTLTSDFGGSPGTLASLSSNRSNNLLRQSSSPAGLLAQLSIDVHSANDKQSLSSPLARSPEDSLSGGTSEENGLGNAPGTPGLIPRIEGALWDDAANSYMSSWNDTAFAPRKRYRDMDVEPINDLVLSSEAPQRCGQHNQLSTLTRHLSLPVGKTKSAVLADDLLQSVPCRIRAKRGCATHPRSIAERVRRTRISERMRKLQELVPNMDKQTNTADMLEEAAEYVKHLQRQVQELSSDKCKCKCEKDGQKQ